MHVPSFLVGSAATGTGFLLIHKQLSHRTRLSAKWALMERAERQFNDLIAEARSSKNNVVDDTMTSTSSNPSFAFSSDQAKNYWNGGITSVREFLQIYVFGDGGAGSDDKGSQ